MSDKILIILRGLPGAGKSTVSALISDVVYEADMYFYDKEGNYNWDGSKTWLAHKWCQGKVKKAMVEGKEKIVVSNTSTTEKELQPYLDLAKEYDYKIISMIVENRHGNVSIHGVPEEAMVKMEQRFEIKLR